MAALGLRCCSQAFSSCGKRGLLFIVVCGLLITVVSLVVEHGLQARRLQQLWRTGLVALRHVGSSRIRDQTRVPCIGRRILNHRTTREVSIPYLTSCHYSTKSRRIGRLKQEYEFISKALEKFCFRVTKTRETDYLM